MQFENSNRVFILNKHGKPLIPCKPRKASLRFKEYGSTPYAKIGACFDCSTSPDFFKHVNKCFHQKY